jgi:glycosyltransferase involved in cell wall biosynthesis
VDHLHNHFVSASASVAMLAARLARIPYSFTLHGPTDLIEPHRWRLDEKIARSEFVSCISHFARSQAMLQAAPEHWHKLKIIHCGVMPERYRKGGGADDSLRLVFVGRLAPVKGLRLLFEALPQVLDRHPNVQLTIVGDGPDRAVLEQLARPFGSAARFEGYKSQAEVAEILAASDAMVLPSFAEGVPVVLMEAMASSLPVLATRVAGVAELVEDGVNGYLVAPGDAEALADRIGNLASDPARRQAMGEAGRRTVEGGFVIEDEARRLLWLFRNGPEGPVRPNLP